MTVADLTVSGDDLATVLGVSPRRVRQLAAEGVVKRASRGRYHLVTSVKTFIAARDDTRRTTGQSEVAAQRRRLLKLQGDRLELENARKSGELIPVAEVDITDEAFLTALRDGALALPDAVADEVCDIAVAEGPAGVAVFLRERIEAFLTDAAAAKFVASEPVNGQRR